jgi:amino acid adenylation domain-containing protein
MLQAVLGILKAGGTYVPLDVAWPADRVETILAGTGAPVIVADRRTLPAVEQIRWRLPRLAHTLCLDVETPEIEPEGLDAASVRSLFDFVAERATDRVTAGGFIRRATGLPFREAEVDEYRDRVLALTAPWLRPDARVLEVGSGSGLILWEMARRVERCVGLDPSERTQERNRAHALAEGITNVELPIGFAHEIGERFAPGSFDLVLLASTVQFFPGPRYLETVIVEALRLLAPGGALVIADVVDARIEPPGDLLALDEDLFRDLGAAEIRHRNDRRGGFASELGERYDVILRPAQVERRKRTWTGWHVERASSSRPGVLGSPADIAYVIHTSGSTGTPKGIAVQHAPAVNLISWVNRTFGVGPRDRLLFVTSLCFDLSVYDVFGVLAAGGTVHVASEAALREPTELVRLLREEPVTIWDSAPAALQQLAPLFPHGEARPLRLVLLSGDWIPVHLPDQVRAAFPGTKVMSLGGATEATVWSNWYPIGTVDPRWPSIPYGRPIANARYHVLDEGLLPCPIGMPGDLYIGGSCLCVGYAGQPDLTAAAFVPDPFSVVPGARLYRTGDRSRFFRDGNLEFLGRVDQQVKVRGYRIELGEIEVALLRHPAVQEAVVTVRNDRLVAYVVLDQPVLEPPDVQAELAGWLRDRLPQYMIPAAFVRLDAMPVTANGKLDRKALPEPRAEGEGDGPAPRTPVEELLAGIWREVLGRERVGVDESFFDLGGHSLLVMQLLARLRSVFGVDLPVRRIFEAPTVAACARVVEEELRGGALVPPPVIPAAHSEGAPLSSAQSRLWFEYQLAPDTAAYNVPLSFRIDGPVRVGALADGLREVVRRHEALRTTFQVIGGEVLQVVGPPPDTVFLLADLTALPPHRREAEVARLARWIGDAPFDLTRGPVLRALCAGVTAESWRLLLALHHIALDGWSGNVLARELVASYQAFAQGRTPLLPELPVQFADFARWERGWMQGEVLAEHERYWLGQLAGLRETPELPGDRSRPVVPTWRAGWAPVRIDAELTEAVRALGRSAGATLFMTLLAAFDALVHLHTGAEDVVVGSAGANRIRPEVEPLIGCFLNLLVLRTNLSGRPAFREVLARARETALGAYAHQGLPFDWLMEAWQRGRADRDTRIFHMLFEMQGGFTPAATPDGLTFTWLPFQPGVVKYDLTVYLREEDGGLGGDVGYNTDRFSAAWVERFLADFRLVLKAMVRDPDRAIVGIIELTGTAALHAELARDLSLDCPPYENVRHWVRRSAAVHAERIAIEEGDAWLTYRELEARASALTDRLLRQGLARGTVVGVLTYASSRLATALLGILEAGGIFLPLDPRVPALRLAALVEEASPGWFVVDPELGGMVAAVARRKTPHILGFDDVERAAGDRSGDFVARPELSGDDPCYIYFTSGSTGRPKGVTGRLRGIDHFVRWEIETFGLGHGPRVSPRVSQIAAPSFDAFLRDTFVPLCTGGTMCVPDRALLADAEWLAGWIDRERIELIHCVPSLFRTLLGTELTPERFPALRYILMAGEPLLPADIQRWAAAFGSRIELVNLYGNSETTMAKFLYRLRPEDAERRIIPAGRPMPGAQGFIVDALGAFRPAGAIGEILIRTPYRSLGYYNRPEETARAFVPNPRSGDPNDLLYRSGDLGRLLEDGNLEFLGRKDQQVKIRGVRVELEEIEGVLSRHEDVREAAVVEQPDGTGGFLLTSFVVLRPGAGAGGIAPLRGYLAERLPDAMVPSRFFAVEELPRSMNGKIDRGALRELALERSGAEVEHVAPRNELEEMVAGLFSRLLRIPRIGAHDNFFQLGGHSLLATQLVARVRYTLDLEVPLRSLLQQPTVAGLAREIEALRRSASGAPEVPPLVPVPRGTDLPLSFAQQRLWFLSQLEPGSPAYNMPFGLRLSGPLNVSALRGTFEAIVRRHESLRTVFRAAGGVPRQAVLPAGAADLPLIDLSALPAAERELQLRAEAEAAFWRPVDLERGPLVRAQLFRLAAHEHAVGFCLHHIVSDAWSIGVLVREITALYGAAVQGQASTQSPLPVQYPDFAAWQRSWLQGETLERQIDFWKQSLAGAEPLALPVDRSAARGAGAWRPGRHWFTVPPDLTERLRELAQGNEATLFMVTLATLKTVLLRLSGQGDLSIGIPIANRTRVEVEGLIGFFVNTLVLRTETGREATFPDLLHQVRRVSLDAQAHQDLPFEKLIEALDPERNLDETPLFRVMFDLAVNPLPEIQLPGLRVAPLAMDGGEAKFDLLLNLRHDGATLQGYLEYRSVLFEAPTIQRLAGYFVAVAESAVAAPERRLAEIPMLGAGERHQVVFERNERRRDLPVAALFPEMFAAQVGRDPEAPALFFDQGEELGSVSYGELADRARRLARWLAGQGVVPGVMVALCMDRTPYLTEGILGILLSGGGYVPLDPDLPGERMELMLRDSGARLLLTRESLLPRIPALVPVACLDRDAERIVGTKGREPVAPPPHAPALMIYTSGSTGQPKGAVTPHRALAWFTRMASGQYEIQPGDRMLQVCSIGFDVSMEETFPYLASGAALCLWSDPLLRSPAAFLEQSRRWNVTAWSPPTAFWHAVVDEIGAGAELPPSLRLVVLGGEAVSPAHLAVWRARVGSSVRLINTYGPTETTVAATLRDLRDPTAGAEGGPVPIGRPLPGAEVHLLDESLEPVPLGVTGEIFLGGGGRVWGYLGYPALTAEKFVPHPFAAEPGERLYRTGDLGRALPDGDLEFVGRTDHQVKIRGFRVEPGEVDAVLGTHRQVRSSVTLVWQPTAGDRRLVTWFVAQPGTAPGLAELRSFLQARLPSYMVPASLEPIVEIPLNRNGKVDRRALPAPQNLRAAAEAYVAPSGPVEEALAAVWAVVLRLDRVGVHDNFFTLGGHSLLATQVVSRVREALGVELPLRRIFEAPTIRQLARDLGTARPADQSAPALELSGAVPDGEAPLSFAQQRLWFLDQLEPGNPAYNLPLPVRLSGELSLEALARTFSEVVRRHAALRTTFRVRSGQPVQVIAQPEPLDLPVLDLSGVPVDVRGAWANELAREEARQPFDLRNGPLLRLGLIRLAAQEHILVVTLHHIVADGWSVGVLLREIEALYPAFLRGAEPSLPELPLQYADFARWQRGWLQGEVLDEHLAWWQQALAGAPELLELPLDRPRPPVQTYRGASIDLTLSSELSTAMGELCRREEVTPFMLLLAAWALVLGRHAGQDDLLVGTPIAGRNRRETEELIGFFVNTLVLRAELGGGGLTFRDLLGRVRETALEAFAHQDLPFELLVDALEVERSLAHTPLIQILLTLQNAPAGALRLPGLTLAPVSWPSATAKFDLALGFVETADGFAGTLEYATDLFDRTTAERFLRHLSNLLADAVAEPGRSLSVLHLLDAAEEQLLVSDLNRADRSWAFPVLVHDLFSQQAARTPDQVAAGAWTYRDVEERSTALASAIQARLSGPWIDRRIGLLADPGPHVLAGMLGILKAGGGFVPIDPRHPDERVAWMLEDAACAVLVTERQYMERAAALGARSVLCLDEMGSGKLRSAPNDPRSLAYVVYTSGSTGRPKGVQVAHESLVPMLLWGCEYFALGEHTRVLQSLSHCFDFGIFEHLTTVLAGGTLCFPGPAAGDPAAFAREIVRQKINTLHTTPVFAHELAGVGQTLESLEILHLGGEALSQATVARLRETAPRAALYNGYGPTEATVNSAIYLIRPADAGWPVLPIGRPSADNALYVLDREGGLVPYGARGELYVGGIGVARGYLNRPELTAERFVPDPFGGQPGGRLYRTGDLVRYLAEGDLEFLGRIDHQVKIRGFRIELGEIEAVLRSHPAVRDGAVLVWEEGDDRRLAAWVVPEATAPADLKTTLAAWLREKLPEHMVPSAFVLLETLPLTANGKVDRKALPAPDRHADESGYVPPTDEVEERLVEIWQEVLRLDRIGVQDNFFALGGHSLLATQVVSRVRERLGKDMPLRKMFEMPTIRQLATWLRGEHAVEASAPVLVAAAPELEGGEPLSFAQQRLWFLDQLEPGNPAYNIPLAVLLTGELSLEALERSFAEVVRRHAALRTTFGTRAGQPMQVIADPAPLELKILDLTAVPDEVREEWARTLAQEDAWHPFDLRCGPLLRLGLLRLAAEEHLLVATLHHVVADGWSVGILLREIGALYPAFLRGEPSPLPELPLQYTDFARWQRDWLQKDLLDRQTAYWKGALAGAPALLELPTDRPRPPVSSSRGASLELALPAALSVAVHEIGRREEATPFMLLLAVWSVLLGRHAGQDDVLVGTPVAGRTRRETEPLIGFFVNTLVLRVELRGGPSFRELLATVRETVLDAFAHQDVPFELLIDELGVERSLAHAPLVQVLLSLQNAAASTLRLPGLTLTPVNLPSVTAKLDLALSLVETAGDLTGLLEYATDLFDRATAERLLRHLTRLLEGAVADPGRSIAELRLMEAAEERQLIDVLNPVEPAWALPVFVHDLFSRQAERTPDKTAAVGPQGAWTYRELEERSDSLAAALQERLSGPGIDRRIGLLAESGPHVLVGMLGILKAGCGFVPVDPRQPDARLAGLLEDAACEALVADSSYLERAMALGARSVLCLDEVGSGALRSDPGDPRSIAYVVYTSGSTGRPKGVQVAHESLVPMLLWGCAYLGLGEHTRVLQSLSHCFDFGIFEHLTTALAGGTLCFPGEAAGDPVAFAREIARQEINTLHTTPAFALALAAAGQRLDSLDILHLGGEALPQATVARLREAAPRAVLYNGYGPTEATINSTIHRIDATDAGRPMVPIGRQSADNRLYVLDRAGRLSPFGARGELHVGGIGVARGYLHRPELTAERFVPDPFGTEPGGRLYRTGDLVRALPEGDLEFLGRIDHQVKLRGFRIELGEIEAVLRSHPAVHEAVVQVWEEGDERRLATWVTLDPSESTPDLAAWLRERLPEPMVPAAFMILETLPLTQNGKLDRAALPAPDRRGDASCYEPPGDALEEQLAAIWQEVLRLDRVGAHDNFFALGGHSLLATQVVSRVREVLGIEMPLRRVFETPTLRRMAGSLRS